MSVVGGGVVGMELVAVGERGRDVAGLPLPPFDPARQPLLVGLGGVMAPDDLDTDPIVRLAGAVTSVERIAVMAAAFRDELVATAYREGAAEYAARLSHLPAGQRREWGARGMLSELAAALHLPERTLARRLARQAALAGFPRFREANGAGLVSAWHCDVMLDIFGAVPDEAALAAADAALVGKALTSTASQLRVAARRWRARHIPRTDAERRRNLADRSVDLAPADDDLCLLTALLPASQAMAIYHRLDDIAATAQADGDDRTRPQLRADAMCDFLLADDPTGAFLTPDTAAVGDGVAQDPTGGGPARSARAHSGTTLGGATGDGEANDHGARRGAADRAVVRAPGRPGGCRRPGIPQWARGIKATVVLTVPVLSLLGHSDEPADLEGFGPIDLDTARHLAGQAPSFIRVLTHPETGAVLSVGRDRYRVPADLKTALVIRDETCRFPGCRRRAVRCDLDHSTPWEHDGRTELCNLEHLCRTHHRLKHELGWTLTHH
ncbi:MAG TPA: DUF222 domain-containing protein, partial [Gemmatimonadales bacterium]|nr:DUF222 domain-containing protein [Gemmatimonadales bacterium]